MAKVTTVFYYYYYYCVPIHRAAQILTQSQNSDEAMFHTENAGLLSKSAVFALWT